MIHDLPQRRQMARIRAHKGMLTGLCFADEEKILSCGHDRTVKMWAVTSSSPSGAEEQEAGPSEVRVLVVFTGLPPPFLTYFE